jgi:hypothetical protein
MLRIKMIMIPAITEVIKDIYTAICRGEDVFMDKEFILRK